MIEFKQDKKLYRLNIKGDKIGRKRCGQEDYRTQRYYRDLDIAFEIWDYNHIVIDATVDVKPNIDYILRKKGND